VYEETLTGRPHDTSVYTKSYQWKWKCGCSLTSCPDIRGKKRSCPHLSFVVRNRSPRSLRTPGGGGWGHVSFVTEAQLNTCRSVCMCAPSDWCFVTYLLRRRMPLRLCISHTGGYRPLDGISRRIELRLDASWRDARSRHKLIDVSMATQYQQNYSGTVIRVTFCVTVIRNVKSASRHFAVERFICAVNDRRPFGGQRTYRCPRENGDSAILLTYDVCKFCFIFDVMRRMLYIRRNTPKWTFVLSSFDCHALASTLKYAQKK